MAWSKQPCDMPAGLWRPKKFRTGDPKAFLGTAFYSTAINHMLELDTFSRRKIAALVGAAPFNRDSGKRQGTRAIWGGRARIRAVLYAFASCGAASSMRFHQVHARGCARIAKSPAPASDYFD